MQYVQTLWTRAKRSLGVDVAWFLHPFSCRVKWKLSKLTLRKWIFGMKLEGVFPSVLLRAKPDSLLTAPWDYWGWKIMLLSLERKKNTELLVLMLLEDSVCHATNNNFVVRISRNWDDEGILHKSIIVYGKIINIYWVCITKPYFRDLMCSVNASEAWDLGAGSDLSFLAPAFKTWERLDTKATVKF